MEPVVQPKRSKPGSGENFAVGISSGMAWNTLELGSRGAFQLAVKLILARLLVPEHFGLVGMAVVFTGLFNVLSDLGLGSAIIQRKENDLPAIQVDSAFWGTLGIAAGLYLFIAFCVAPLAGWFYGEPLISILVIVLGLPVLLTPFTVIAKATLTRELAFRKITTANVISIVVAGATAVIAALLGAGVWSIVILSLVAAAVRVPLLWIAVPWRPSWQFSQAQFRELFAFGKYITVNRVFSYVTRNVDYLLIGKLLGAQALGVYTLAFFLTDVVRSKLKSLFDTVFYPVFSKQQDDLHAMRRYYLLTVRYNALAALPFLALLGLYADMIVGMGLGEAWLGAVIPVQILCVACAVHAVGGSSAPVIRALGRPDLNVRFSIMKIAIAIPLIVVGARLWGVNGVALAVVGYKLFARVLLQFYLRRLIGVRERAILSSLMPVVAGVAFITIIYWIWLLLGQPRSGLHLGVVGIMSVAGYSMVVYAFIREEVGVVIAQWTGRGHPRPARSEDVALDVPS